MVAWWHLSSRKFRIAKNWKFRIRRTLAPDPIWNTIKVTRNFRKMVQSAVQMGMILLLWARLIELTFGRMRLRRPTQNKRLWKIPVQALITSARRKEMTSKANFSWRKLSTYLLAAVMSVKSIRNSRLQGQDQEHTSTSTTPTIHPYARASTKAKTTARLWNLKE